MEQNHAIDVDNMTYDELIQERQYYEKKIENGAEAELVNIWANDLVRVNNKILEVEDLYKKKNKPNAVKKTAKFFAKLFFPDPKVLKRVATNDYNEDLQPGALTSETIRMFNSNKARFIHPSFLKLKNNRAFLVWMLVSVLFILIGLYLVFSSALGIGSLFSRLNGISAGMALVGLGVTWAWITSRDKTIYENYQNSKQ